MNGDLPSEKSRRNADSHAVATRGQILSLGSINADFQVRTERRPEISETMVAHQFSRQSGGKAANVAFLASKLGVDARLFGQVGDDDLARQALGSLRGLGVDLSGVKQVPGKSTGVAMITVPPDGKKGIVMAPNANEAWSDEDSDRVALALRNAPPGSVLVADCEIAVSALEQAMQAARQCGLKVILDPSPADRVTDTLLALTDIVVPNSGEAQSMTGIECRDPKSAIRAANRLRERGAAAACIKLPDGGCVLVDGARIAHIASVPVDVVDTTGAGDAFAGAFAVAVLEQRPYIGAMRFAVAASHLAVTGYGSQPAYPSREQIEQMEQRLDVNTDVERPD
jgi:ribokinase